MSKSYLGEEKDEVGDIPTRVSQWPRDRLVSGDRPGVEVCGRACVKALRVVAVGEGVVCGLQLVVVGGVASVCVMYQQAVGLGIEAAVPRSRAG